MKDVLTLVSMLGVMYGGCSVVGAVHGYSTIKYMTFHHIIIASSATFIFGMCYLIAVAFDGVWTSVLGAGCLSYLSVRVLDALLPQVTMQYLAHKEVSSVQPE